VVAKGTDAAAAEAVIAEVVRLIEGFGRTPVLGEPDL